MQNRKPFIAGNWKMYKTVSEAVETAGRLTELIADAGDVDIMIAPAYTALAPMAAIIRGSLVSLGGQDLFWEDEGAFTGQISAAMLVSAGCSHVIIGHSERRQLFGETDETVNKKIKAAVKSNLIPVFCVGETENERESGKTFSVLDKQVKMGLKGFFAEDLKTMIVAYEPVWAIGTGKTATTDQAQEVHQFIRSLLDDYCGQDLAAATRILYGGSVKPENIADLMSMPDIDGALVGGASLDAESFSRIVKFK